MEFRIIGPLEVVNDGRPVSIRRGKEQALLAYLLLHPNEVVPSDRLIDALWDERPPPTASKILQNAVSHLRRELGENRLLTRDPGYVLRVEKGELDVQRFEQLAKEGRGDDALALWRGTHSSVSEASASQRTRAAVSRSSVSRCSRTGSRLTSQQGATQS
jgi:DNA-binding SARP family transcriptional activator